MANTKKGRKEFPAPFLRCTSVSHDDECTAAEVEECTM